MSLWSTTVLWLYPRPGVLVTDTVPSDTSPPWCIRPNDHKRLALFAIRPHFGMQHTVSVQGACIPGHAAFSPGRLQVGPRDTGPLRQDRSFDFGFQHANGKVEVLFGFRKFPVDGLQLGLDLRHDD